MARNVILRVRDGDPACDRAREVITRMAAELGLELDVRTLDPSPGDPLPQVVLWDGTAFDRVADEATLRDAITAKIWSEDATAGAGGRERDAQFAREEVERNVERERFAKVRARRKGWVPREVPGGRSAGSPEEGPPSRGGEPDRPEGAEGRGTAPSPPTPVLLRGGRRGRRELAARVARKLREGVPLLLIALFVFVAMTFGNREAREDDPGPRGVVSGEAPRLDLPTLDDFRFDLARERGRAVLIVPFDARKPSRDALLALAAEAQKALELSRGEARVVAIGVGAGVAELRAALPDLPSALAVAADVDGSATGAFATGAGQGAGWWLVDRAGRVVGRGGRPGPEAFAALLASAR